MESVIIEEMRAFMRLDLNPRQKQYFADTIAVAKRVDITFEFALQDAELLEHEYVVFGEYDLRTLERITRETGYYGDIYRNIYIERVKDNPRRNEVTPGVGTQ